MRSPRVPTQKTVLLAPQARVVSVTSRGHFLHYPFPWCFVELFFFLVLHLVSTTLILKIRLYDFVRIYVVFSKTTLSEKGVKKIIKNVLVAFKENTSQRLQGHTNCKSLYAYFDARVPSCFFEPSPFFKISFKYKGQKSRHHTKGEHWKSQQPI